MEARGGGEWEHFLLQNINSESIALVNGDNVPNHNAMKQGLYCSHRNLCKAFQCDLSYFDQRQTAESLKYIWLIKWKWNAVSSSCFAQDLFYGVDKKTNILFVKQE